MKKLVSIIIPVYNCEKYIIRCLKSVLHQTYKNIEVIVVDDGSVDKTSQYIKELESIDKRIRYFRKENEGVSTARNYGLENICGDYVTFVDADDYVDEYYVEKLYIAIQEFNADISICGVIDEVDGDKISNITQQIKNDGIKTPICFSVENGYNYMDVDYSYRMVWGAMYKYEVVCDIKFARDIYVAEDLLFFAQTAKKAENIVHIYDELYHYVIYNNSACHGKFDLRKNSVFEGWRRTCEEFRDIPEVYNSACARYAIACRKMCIDYYADDLFRRSYYKSVVKLYRKNMGYIWKTAKVSVMQKGLAFSFAIFPSIYIFIRNVRK